MSSFLNANILYKLSQITPFGLRCYAPPRGASESCIQCYELACDAWFEEFYNCE